MVPQVQELQENYTEAYQSYTDALASEDEGQGECLSEADRALCRAGLARTAILHGDFARGRDLAASTGDADLLRQCAALLEELQQGQVKGPPWTLAAMSEQRNTLETCCIFQHLMDMDMHASHASWSRLTV